MSVIDLRIGYDPIIRDIEGYQGKYQISENGEVYNKITGAELSQSLNYKGYNTVSLYDTLSKKSVGKRIHQLVCRTFIENPYGLPQVDHINRIKTDNNTDNLRWVNSSQNNHNKDTPKTNTSGEKNIRKRSRFIKGKLYYNWVVTIDIGSENAKLEGDNRIHKYFSYNEEGFKTAIRFRDYVRKYIDEVLYDNTLNMKEYFNKEKKKQIIVEFSKKELN